MPRKIMPKTLETTLVRYEKNPIISKKDVKFPCSFVFNAGAIKYNNKYTLLLRVQDLGLTSHFALATSENGLDFNVSESYAFSPSHMESCDEYGVEDSRITRIGKDFYVAYTALSDQGPAVGLAKTTNFKKFKRFGIILPPDDKDAILLPEKVKDEYILFHRPSSSKSIWVCYSDDLIHWGKHKPVLRPRSGSWDSEKVGAGAVPIKTDKGWLHIYHGVSGRVYRLGAALFDLKDPSKLIRRSENYILAPEMNYEMTGGVPNVVFTCGAILENDGEVKVYYGAADSHICLATGRIEKLVEMAEKY